MTGRERSILQKTPILDDTTFLSDRNDIYSCEITRRIAGGRTTALILLTLAVWGGLSLIIIEIIAATEIFYLFILMILEFLSIVPAMIWLIKNQRRFRQKAAESFYAQFHVNNGELYLNGFQMNVIRNTKKKQMILDDLNTSKTTFYAATFTATVDGGDVDGFAEFCKNNGIKISEI